MGEDNIPRYLVKFYCGCTQENASQSIFLQVILSLQSKGE